MHKNALFLAVIGIITFFLYGPPAHAQDLSGGTAVGILIKDKVINGAIITTTSSGYRLATSPYDPQMFGVVNTNPAFYIKNLNSPKDTPVINTGHVQVLVSSQNGNIAVGDLITSSTIPGVGQKAVDNGFVLGQAEQSYASNNPQKAALILITLQPHYAQVNNNLIHNSANAFTLGLSAAFTTPLGVIRYFVAGIITLSSFFFGFRFFARVSNRGVEAIGRNPLAKQAILLSVLINTIITVAIMLFGVAISYLILVL